MNKETLNKAIEIKNKIERLQTEIDRLPITTHRRRLFRFKNAEKEMGYHGLYAIKFYTALDEILELDKDDINALIEIRKNKIKVLEEELTNL